MPLLNDNDLDRLSREAADQYDVEQGTSGWEALEHRLNLELPQNRRRRRLLLWWLLAGTLLLGGALWGLKPWQGSGGKEGIAKEERNSINLTKNNNRKESNSNTENPDIPAAPQATGNGSTGTPGSQAGGPNGEPAPTAENEQVKPVSEIQNNNLTVPNQTDRNNRQSGLATVPQGTGKMITITKRPPAADPNLPVNRNSNKRLSQSSVISATQSPTNSSVIPYTQQQDLPDKNDSVTRSNPVQTSSIQNAPDVPGRKPTPQTSITDSTQQPATVQPTQTTANKTKPLNLSSRKNSFYAIALAGLDFSNVKFSSAGRTGFNGGFQIGYYLTDKLSVNTGLIYNKKNYKARAKDFTPKGPMVYYNIDKIEGGCSMFDIPLNLRYDLGIKARSRYFISAGVSSYLMDREDYDYYFYNSNGDYSQKNWNTSQNSNYLFSILNFSAGVEKQLSKKINFQAEPYLKVPVKGVGNGNIQLNSFGINLGLKYQFGKKK